MPAGPDWVIVVGSVALCPPLAVEEFAPEVMPPPKTVTPLVTDAGALAATDTVSVTGG